MAAATLSNTFRTHLSPGSGNPRCPPLQRRAKQGPKHCQQRARRIQGVAAAAFGRLVGLVVIYVRRPKHSKNTRPQMCRGKVEHFPGHGKNKTLVYYSCRQFSAVTCRASREIAVYRRVGNACGVSLGPLLRRGIVGAQPEVVGCGVVWSSLPKIGCSVVGVGRASVPGTLTASREPAGGDRGSRPSTSASLQEAASVAPMFVRSRGRSDRFGTRLRAASGGSSGALSSAPHMSASCPKPRPKDEHRDPSCSPWWQNALALPVDLMGVLSRHRRADRESPLCRAGSWVAEGFAGWARPKLGSTEVWSGIPSAGSMLNTN